MPIGKDSIKTRVAKVAATEDETPKAEAPAVEASVAEAPGEVAIPVSEAAPKADSPAEAKPAPKKRAPAKKKPAAPKAEAPSDKAVDTAVLANVAPETVEAVVGHKENAKVEHVQVGQRMPNYLL